MDWSSTSRLKLMQLNVFLLLSTNIACLQGDPLAGDHDLHCVTDYLSTTNCTLSMVPSENTDGNTPYWLTFIETYELETFNCMLKNTSEDYFCSVKTSDPTPDDDDFPETFTDTDTFEISLCHNQNDGSKLCKVLDDEYAPFTNIKPNAPCCLSVSHNSSQHHFTWNSTYEKYRPSTDLVDNLKYQLHYFKREDKHDGNMTVTPHDINTDRTSYSVDDQMFVPDTEYVARVRSSPNQVFYKGQWSDWSSEVHWRTESAMNDLPNKFVSGMVMKVFILLCVMVPIILLLCYAPVQKWRQNAFIPTPAPYFQNLYSDCQGDFKSWVITQEHSADMLKAEASLQIDTLIKCADAAEEDRQPRFHHPLMEGSQYSNIIDPVCDTSLLGIPYAVSTMSPLSDPGSSLKSLTLSSQPGSPAEGDSGCWLCSDTSLEKDSPWYCNEYCTLSTLQQTSPVTAEHHGSSSTKFCPQGIIRADAIQEA